MTYLLLSIIVIILRTATLKNTTPLLIYGNGLFGAILILNNGGHLTPFSSIEIVQYASVFICSAGLFGIIFTCAMMIKTNVSELSIKRSNEESSTSDESTDHSPVTTSCLESYCTAILIISTIAGVISMIQYFLLHQAMNYPLVSHLAT